MCCFCNGKKYEVIYNVPILIKGGKCKMKVIKRDGRAVDFDRAKIQIAIEKANKEVKPKNRANKEDIKGIVQYIEELNKKRILVEDIQDLIEEKLMEIEKYELAKKYIVYRYTRALVRKQNTTDETILGLIRNENKELAEENSNKNTMLASTQRDYIAGEVSRDLTKRLLLPEKIAKADAEGILHFHDADYFVQPIFNCCLVNIGDMLDNGTVMNGKMIESPKSFQVACTVTTQIIAAVASNQYGGQSVDLKHLGKYLRKSYNKYKKQIEEKYKGKLSGSTIEELVDVRVRHELEAGVQTIQYQINTLMTTNGQSPFVTLFLHLEDDDPYIKENAMIIEEVLRQRYEGIKNEAGIYVTPAFPKLVYVLDECNCLKGGKYDYLTKMAVKCSAKRMYPDYISAKKMKENYEGNVFSPMGCRSFLIPWKDENGNYKFEGRFNQGVVTINLVDVACSSGGDMTKFWKIFDERLDLCYRALMCRHNRLKGTLSDAAPILWQHGALARLKKGEKIDKLLYDGYSTISLGYAGLYECTKYMTGKSHTDPEGKPFALHVMEHMNEACDKWKQETNIDFSIYGTPLESTTYKFAKCLQKRFGKIPGVTDRNYITNSYHVHVAEKIDAFTKLKFESEFQRLSPGGAISYVEVPNMQNNIPAVLQVMKYIYENIMYAELNTKSDYCQCCGYDGEIQIVENEDGKLIWRCPKCGNEDQDKMNVARRTCGYIGTQFWNQGRTQEIKERVLHL